MTASDQIGDAILQRVYSEFLEMPGLRLTCQQAQRLWGLDEHTCHKLLQFLVDAKFLWQPARGTYGRLTDGHVHGPRPRIGTHGAATREPTVNDDQSARF